MNKELTIEDLKIIFDVLNVYDPNDIQDIYPEMGEKEFLDGIKQAWEKILPLIRSKQGLQQIGSNSNSGQIGNGVGFNFVFTAGAHASKMLMLKGLGQKSPPVSGHNSLVDKGL